MHVRKRVNRTCIHFYGNLCDLQCAVKSSFVSPEFASMYTSGGQKWDFLSGYLDTLHKHATPSSFTSSRGVKPVLRHNTQSHPRQQMIQDNCSLLFEAAVPLRGSSHSPIQREGANTHAAFLPPYSTYRFVHPHGIALR